MLLSKENYLQNIYFLLHGRNLTTILNVRSHELLGLDVCEYEPSNQKFESATILRRYQIDSIDQLLLKNKSLAQHSILIYNTETVILI